ncbi:MAG: flagellar biosynthetic protein FliO [Rhabdochlamydiaceae bacterium]|nr:flagellar biosynthetic protein FliO [Candidatus Amphrikana amoebophyrae]
MCKRILLLFLFISSLSFTQEPNSPCQPGEQFEQTEKSFTPLDTTDYKVKFIKTIVWIFFILGLILLLLWLVKRFSSKRFTALNQQKYVKIIEKRAISPKTMLYVIEIGGKHLLISESQFEVEFLSQIETQSEPTSL